MTRSIKDIVTADNQEAIKEGNSSYLSEVLEHGCVSGIVSRLIYYKDSLAFYEEHKEEIGKLLQELIYDTGMRVDELIRQWDTSDAIVIETNNQNLMAWFGYETIARKLMEDN